MSVDVLVAVGGVSAERAVSLRSGVAVADALANLGYSVATFDLCEKSARPLIERRPDVVFIALHGTFGEDGVLQHQLEREGVVYTGSGPIASRRAMDKVLAKERFFLSRVPTAPFVCASAPEYEHAVSAVSARFGFPIVVKPVMQGSSLGVSIVKNAGQVAAAGEAAFAHDPRALIEPCLVGRELTVGILDGHPLPILEIEPARGFFDYQAKYADPDTRCRPALDMSAATTLAVQQAALGAHEALGCRGATRVDLMLTADGVPWVLEVNTIPGMTATSLLPRAAEAAGIGFGALCQRLVELASRDALLAAPTWSTRRTIWSGRRAA